MKQKLWNPKIALAGIFLSALSLQVHAQNPKFTWVKSMGSTTAERGCSIAVDNYGNVYSTGYFADALQLDFGTNTSLISNGDNDIYLIKQDASGKLIWAKTIGSTTADNAYALAVDKTGAHVYLTGDYSGTVDFDPGTGVVNHTSASGGKGKPGSDLFISKFDSAGIFQWVRVAGNDGAETGSAITMDAESKHVLVTGTFGGTVDFGFGQNVVNLTGASATCSFILKITDAGSLVWARAFDGDDISTKGISADAAGNVYTTGGFWGSADFNPDTTKTAMLTDYGNYDAFVCKLSAGGAYEWAKKMGGADFDLGQGITADNTGNVYCTGLFQNTANFNANGNTSLNANGAADAFIAKLNTKGELVWVKNVGASADDEGYGIALDILGNVYATGRFQGPADFNPGLNAKDTFTLVGYGGFDGYTLKLDNNGNFKWAVSIGTRFGPDITNAIAVSNGYIYTIGEFWNTSDFDPQGPNLHQLTSKGEEDIFMLKLFDCTPLSGQQVIISGPDSVCIGQTYTYHATRLEGAASYTWTLPSGWKGSSTADSISVVVTEAGTLNVTAKGFCDSVINQYVVATYMPAVHITIDGFTLSTTSKDNYKTCQWYLDGKIINGATSASYTIKENGLYSVVVTGGKNCIDSALYEVTNTNTIPELSDQAIVSIYPNPVQDKVYIKASLAVQITLVSIDGRVLQEGKLSTTAKPIDLSHYASGMYLLRVKDSNGRLLRVEKLIKE